MTPDDLDRAVAALQGMAYQVRLRILILLRDGETTPAVLTAAIGVHPTVVSHHLRNLSHAGLIRRERRGRNAFYSIPDEATARLVDAIAVFVSR